MMKSWYSLILGLLLSGSLVGQSDPLFTKTILQYRKNYLSAFKNNPNAPLSKKAVKQVQFFPPDEQYYVLAKFSPTPQAEAFDLPHYSGQTRPYVQFGVLHFQLNGQSLQLNVYRSLSNRLPPFQDRLFVPFKDLSNGEVTYGGGRYLDLRSSDILDNEVMLDFNKAYNPYCAYSDGYVCPIPPAENHLPIAILAGEKNFPGRAK